MTANDGGQGCHVRLSRVAKTGIDVATIIGKMPLVFFSFLEVTSATQFYISSRVVRVVSGVFTCCHFLEVAAAPVSYLALSN